MPPFLLAEGVLASFMVFLFGVCGLSQSDLYASMPDYCQAVLSADEM